MERKTKEQIEELKRQWRNDPCYDLEDAPGFEEYEEELKAYRLDFEAQTKARIEAEHSRLASLVCPRTFTGHSYKGDFGQDQFEIQYQNCIVEQCAWWLTSAKCCAVLMTGNTGRL